MPALTDKVDHRSAPAAIVGEAHVIGEDTAGLVFLNERPPAGTTVTIAGFTEVVGAPAAGEFRVIYAGDGADSAWGKVIFNAADEGTAITVDYDGVGSDLYARDVNRVHQKLAGVRVLTDGATITLDFGDEWANRVTMGGDRDVVVGVFPPAGSFVVTEFIQDGTGTRVPTWDSAGAGADFDFGTDGAPTLSTAAGARDILTWYSTGTVLLFVGMKGGYA